MIKKTLLTLGIFVLISATPVWADVPVYYGSTPNLDNSWQGLPVCADPKPKAPILYEPGNPALPKAKNPGEVRLQWTKVPGASKYNIYYGLSSRNYIFSVPNLGDTDNYTVGLLGNRAYYFAVQANTGCATSNLSNEWKAWPLGADSAWSYVPPVQTGKSSLNQGQITPSPTVAPQPGVVKPTVKPVLPVTRPLPTSQPAGLGGIFQRILNFFAGLFSR